MFWRYNTYFSTKDQNFNNVQHCVMVVLTAEKSGKYLLLGRFDKTKNYSYYLPCEFSALTSLKTRIFSTSAQTN